MPTMLSIKEQIELESYLTGLGIETRRKGDELEFHHCPFCEASGKTPRPFGHFLFNVVKGTYFCRHQKSCSAKGGYVNFKMRMGHYTPLTKARTASVSRPKDNPALTTSDRHFAAYRAKRGVSAKTAKQYGVSFLTRDDGTYYVWSYYAQDKTLINRKYRHTDDKKKTWTEKNCEHGYYGAQFIDPQKGSLHVVEGEDDVHAMADIGIQNVVGLPYGAGTYTPAMDRVNDQFDEILLLFDLDDAGQEGALKFAEKAGFHKCKNVLLPYKDPRDCLLEGLDIFDIQKCISEAKGFRHEQIIKASDARSDVKKRMLDLNQAVGTPIEAWPEWTRLFGGIRLKELTTIIGHTGEGKTTFALNLAFQALAIGFRVMILPFENSIEQIVRKSIEIRTEKQMFHYDRIWRKWFMSQGIDERWIDEQIDALDRNDVYFLNRDNDGKKGFFNFEKLEEIMSYASKYHNVNFFVVDHLQYLLGNNRRFENERQEIDDTMRGLKRLTDDLNSHICLITHPYKTEDSKTGKKAKLTTNSSKGSGSISQESDNFIIVERPEMKGDESEDPMVARVRIMKTRELGVRGSVLFKVKPNGNTFFETEVTAS